MMHTLGNPAAANTNVIALNKPSVRTIARQQNVDLGQLLLILSHRRPAGTKTEENFVVDFLDPIEGMQSDEFGNRYIRVGTAPVMWSCHTDTVSDEGGMQNIKWQGDVLALNEPKRGQSLGADDGAGLWLLLEMLKAGREGLYVFHREEEVGGVGSKWIAKNTPELIDGITMAIAFDRKGTGSVITRQRGRKCCSDEFGQALADELSKTEGLKYKLDPTGVFTDTASYTQQIAECTNVSVGYYDEHGETETLDVAHLLQLREALLALDVTTLPVKRDPTEVEDWGGYGYGGYSYGGYSQGWNRRAGWEGDNDPIHRMQKIVEQRPYSVAKMFHNMGLTPFALEQMISNLWARDGSGLQATPTKTWTGPLADVGKDEEGDEVLELEEEQEIFEEDMLFCNRCQDFDQSGQGSSMPQDGDHCGYCGSNNTEVHTVDVNAVTGELVQ